MSPNDAGSTVQLPRVVHVSTAHHADDVRIFERECRSLASTGRYSVYVAAAGSLPPDSGVQHIPLSPVPPGRAKRFSSGPLKALALSRALAADVWHFHDPELLPIAFKLARSGTPVIWDAHEDYLSQFTPDGGKNWVPPPVRGAVRQGMQVMLEAVDRRAAGIVAATTTIAGRYTNPRTVVVGNEARFEDFSTSQPDFTSKRLLFTGPLTSSQLFEEVVGAVEKLPGVTLAVAGRDPDISIWRDAQSRLGGRLEHLGWLNRGGLCEAMSDSALGLVTYSDTDAYTFAAPTKLYEFCAAGLPVAASPNASSVRLIKESGGGFLAEGFSSEAIARSIESALADRRLWDVASARGREWAKRSASWEASERRLLDLYTSILGQ